MDLRFSIKRMFFCVGLSSVGANACAGSIGIDYEQLNQSLDYMGQTVALSPSGPALHGSFDVNEQWSLDVDLQRFDDDFVQGNRFSGSSDIRSWGAGVGYSGDTWYYSVGYHRFEDERYYESIDHPLASNLAQNTDTDSFSASLGYSWIDTDIFYSLSLGGQWSDWQGTSTEHRPSSQPPDSPNRHIEKLFSEQSGHSTSVSAAFSVARYWTFNGDQGVLLGSSLSWVHLLSGDSRSTIYRNRLTAGGGTRNNSGRVSTVADSGRGIAVAGLDSLSADDSYGRVLLYVSYDLLQNLALDFDTSVDIASENNGLNWSVGVSYYF